MFFFVDLPVGFDELSRPWHANKIDQMNKNYDEIGKTPKKGIKETDIDSLVKGLIRYLKNREKDAFTSAFTSIDKGKQSKPKDEVKLAEEKKMFAKARRNRWCFRYEHTGSVYEGVKANNDIEYDLMFVMRGEQFDVSKPFPGYPGFFNIVQKPEERRRSVLNNLLIPHCHMKTVITNKSKNNEEDQEEEEEEVKNYLLSPERVLQRFESVVTKYLNEKKLRKEKQEKVQKDQQRSQISRMTWDRFVVRRHGPAIQVDFYKKKIEEVKKSDGVSENDDELWYHVDLVPCYKIKGISP